MSEKSDAKKGKAKESISNFWQKTTDIGKKAAEEAKSLAEQAKKGIQEQQAKKYTPVTEEELKSEDFLVPSLIEIVDDYSKRDIITQQDAIGWIELHKEVRVLHMYFGYAPKSDFTFIPVIQRDAIYCSDNFEAKKFINSIHIFGKATEEKMAELARIAHSLGAKKCSIEIMEADTQGKSISLKSSLSNNSGEIQAQAKKSNMQSGKRVISFDGNNTPTRPVLKWFANDDNIKDLIEMRCSNDNSIKATTLELSGACSATMSIKIACAIDNILKISGGISMEKQAQKEYASKLIFELEF
ncbi:MAG: hypothetical protein J6A83_03565 [Clostridia bacterium]|nr:hypothetical protein [Clostridia bacterium]